MTETKIFILKKKKKKKGKKRYIRPLLPQWYILFISKLISFNLQSGVLGLVCGRAAASAPLRAPLTASSSAVTDAHTAAQWEFENSA